MGAVFRQLLAHRDHFVPGLRWAVGIQPGRAEHVLVVVGNDGRALERDAPGLALDPGVGHQRGVETVEPGLAVIAFDQIIEGYNQSLFDQVIGIDREHDRQLRRLARVQRRQGTDTGIVVVAGIDRIDLDVRVGGFEVRDDPVDDFGQGTTDSNRIVHGQFGLGMCRQRKPAGQSR